MHTPQQNPTPPTPYCTAYTLTAGDTPPLHPALYHALLLTHGGLTTTNNNRQTTTHTAPCLVIMPPHNNHSTQFLTDTQGHGVSYTPCLMPQTVSTPTSPKSTPIPDLTPWKIAHADITQALTQPNAIPHITPWIHKIAHTVTPEHPTPLAHFYALLEQNYHTQQRANFYANAMGISVDTLNNICRTQTGNTLGQLIRHRLIQTCQHQLLYTQKSIAQIAQDMGFSSQTYFVRTFKRETKTTPAKYRKLNTP